jgi:RNA polymerase sigma-70 factor (ECF subfamily)
MQYRVVAAGAFTDQRQHLWDLCYRVTGSVTDADALLRDCFARAIDQPVAARDADWRVRLTRAAASLAMETFGQRRRRRYVGPWLPSPIETGNAASRAPRPGESLSRYDLVESSSFAFLRALEALDPRERLIFVMGDALGHDPFEMASTLDLPAGAVRGTLLSARRSMDAYDAAHLAPTREVQANAAETLHHCLSQMQQHHVAALEHLCAPDVEAAFDSGGEFVAPLEPIHGAGRVARLLVKFVEGSAPVKFAFRMLNGMPAALGTTGGRPRWARRFVFRIDARDGLITNVQLVLASAKLAAVRFD